MGELLTNLNNREDYSTVVEQLSQALDVTNLLDFILHFIPNGNLLNPDKTKDIYGRARRLMVKIASASKRLSFRHP